MPTPNIVRRGKRRISVRVTLSSRRRKSCGYSVRDFSGHSIMTRNTNDEKPVRKTTCAVGSASSGSARKKKKHQGAGEKQHMGLPPARFRLEFPSEEMEQISGIVKSLSGEATITHLFDTLTARGFERNFAVEKVQQLVDTRKVIVDNDGYICWTYNPVLAAHYRGHPELRIR